MDSGTRDCESRYMSFIPFNAVSGALTPVNRSTNEMVRARQVQIQKDSHHAEDVEELDDTAVNSVRDGQQRDGRGKNPTKRQHDLPKEKVDIEALNDAPPVVPEMTSLSNLDISA